MPTPVGHAVAGLATAWFFDTRAPGPSRRLSTLTAACVTAAVFPDVDILIHSHRTYTHSVGAVLVAGIVAMVASRARRRSSNERREARDRIGALALGAIVAAAYATHILLDWLAKDSAPPFGLMALWPFSSRFYLSHADIFLEVSRRYWKPAEFIFGNLKAVVWELVLLGPLAALAGAIRPGPSGSIQRGVPVAVDENPEDTTQPA
jgi:LexA-binding, inner membrane-associated putative hydrolase